MLHLPPTVIGLGRSDIKDYDRRRKVDRLANYDNVRKRLVSHLVTGPEESKYAYRSRRRLTSKYSALRLRSLLPDEAITKGDRKSSRTLSLSNHDSYFSRQISKVDHHCVTASTNSEISENSSSDISQGCSISYPSIYYEDQGLNDDSLKDSPRRSLSFDTPASLVTSPSDPTESKNQIALNISYSSCIRSCDDASRWIFHNSSEDLPQELTCIVNQKFSGSLFSQSPRKSTGYSPRALRHQKNSFSFDSSERESLNDEQDQDPSILTNGTVPKITKKFNLHVKPRKTSLQSSQVTPNTSKTFRKSRGSESNSTQDVELLSDHQRIPWLTGLHSLNTGQGLPEPDYSSETAISSNSGSSVAVRSDQDSHGTRPKESEEVISCNNADHNNSTTVDDLSLLMNHHSIQKSAVDIFNTGERTQPVSIVKSSSQNYKIYNDKLPPEIQPQTPASLPEFYHRSQRYLYFTVPNPWSCGRSQTVRGRGVSRAPFEYLRATTSFIRRLECRSVSPVGLTSDGLLGLYGGRENGDDEKNWLDGVSHSNAQMNFERSGDTNVNESGLERTSGPENRME